MKLLAALLEDDDNMAMIPFFWLMPEERKEFIRDGYEVIPIPGYQETEGYRVFKIIGPFDKNNYWFRKLSIPIWEDWKLTARYASRIEIMKSTNGQQMFKHMDDDEKIQALRYGWYQTTLDYIIKYFEDHPDLQKRVRHYLKREEIHDDFKKLFYQ